jgi:hypothetical protein
MYNTPTKSIGFSNADNLAIAASELVGRTKSLMDILKDGNGDTKVIRTWIDSMITSAINCDNAIKEYCQGT